MSRPSQSQSHRSATSRERSEPGKSKRSSTRRTLDDVRDQVVNEIAVRTMSKGETVDGVRVGVMLTLPKTDDEEFLRRVAAALQEQMLLMHHVFAIATTGPSTRPDPRANTLLICGSPETYVQRAVLLVSSKLMGRIEIAHNDGAIWIAVVHDISPAPTSADETALWDALRKCALAPMDPLIAPPGSRGAEVALAAARARLQRLTAVQAHEELLAPAVGAPTFLVDIRSESERARAGGIPGSLVVERNVLEWRFDPRSDERLLIVDRYDLRVIVFCENGTASSLAAVALLDLGLLNATDIVGGYRAWQKAGLPINMDGDLDEPSEIHIFD
ncbi:Rhodanese domain-containing protein [Mycena sanguinolenta]|uniref:Rhodanese domain-containing protein n=1 Tax=Mycena sanguinolenta TaxID=230812 RepID=A0A8H6ZFF5_9AGAR|nr:Rhodanese domain-containing protein [Mycena sanguinolenta]